MYDVHMNHRSNTAPIIQQNNNYYSGPGPHAWQRAGFHPMQSSLYFGPRFSGANPGAMQQLLGMLANYARGGQQQPTSPRILKLETDINTWEAQKKAPGVSDAAKRNFQKKIDAARAELETLRPQNNQCAQNNPCAERNNDPIRFMHMLYSFSRMFSGGGRPFV